MGLPGVYVGRKTAALLVLVLAALLLLLGALGALYGLCRRRGAAPAPPTPGPTEPAQTPAPTSPPGPTRPPGPWSGARLPRSLRPLHYELELWPRARPGLPGAPPAFTGRVNITVRCSRDTAAAVLHSAGLRYEPPPAVRGPRGPVEVARLWLEERRQYAVLELRQALRAGGRYVLQLAFQGALDEDPHGLFLTRYTDRGRPRSEECAKSELDVFQIAPMQTCIEKSLYVEIPPLSAITESSPLDFFIAGNGEDYMDLNNTLLYLCCKIVKGDGTDLDAGAAVGLVNYPLASVFSQLDVTLGDRLISQSNNCYSYRAFIESVLNFSDDTLATQFSTGLFYKDTPGHHEMVAQDGDNQGFRRRANLTDQSKKIELLGHLHSDLFFQEKLLLNGVDVKIKLTRSKDAFCLMGTAAAGPCKLKITSASLFVKKVKVAPGV